MVFCWRCSVKPRVKFILKISTFYQVMVFKANSAKILGLQWLTFRGKTQYKKEIFSIVLFNRVGWIYAMSKMGSFP